MVALLPLLEFALNRAFVVSLVSDLNVEFNFDAASIRNRTKSMSLSGREGSDDESDWSDGMAISLGDEFKVVGRVRGASDVRCFSTSIFVGKM